MDTQLTTFTTTNRYFCQDHHCHQRYYSPKYCQKLMKNCHKLIQTFDRQVLQLSPSSSLHSSSSSSTSCTTWHLLIDNRNYQLRLSTEELLNQIEQCMNNSHNFINDSNCENHETRLKNLKMFNDCFVLPNKMWLLLCFVNDNVCRKFFHNFHSAYINNSNGGGGGNDNYDHNHFRHLIQQTGLEKIAPIPDSLYNITVERFQPNVSRLVQQFTNPMPNGLYLIKKFITEQEEKQLLSFLNKEFEQAFNPSSNNDITNISSFSSSLLRNRTAIHFGGNFDYHQNCIVASNTTIPTRLRSMPREFNFILNRLSSLMVYKGITTNTDIPDQCTVNRYQSDGDHIPPHVDTHSMCTDCIMSLSIGSPIVMRFDDGTGIGSDTSTEDKITAEVRQLILPRLSVLVLQDEARYGWRHGISQTKVDIRPMHWDDNADSTHCVNTTNKRLALNLRGLRYSLTFRKMTPLGYKCQCRWPMFCDSQQQLQQQTKEPISDNVEKAVVDQLSNQMAAYLEANYVHRTYNQIATHFSATRYSTWPKVVQFLNTLPPGTMCADIGCGNGKYLGVNQGGKIFILGTDRSEALLHIAGVERGYECFLDDILHLGATLRTGVFDAAISVAVLHHLASIERRQQALQSIMQLLSIGGRALIIVWAFEQRTRDGTASRYLRNDCGDSGDGQKGNNTTSASIRNQLPLEQHHQTGTVKLPIHRSGTSFQEQNLFVPWKSNTNKKSSKDNQIESSFSSNTNPTALRYYHVFREGELEQLCTTALGDTITLEQIYYDQGNWCVIFRRVK